MYLHMNGANYTEETKIVKCAQAAKIRHVDSFRSSSYHAAQHHQGKE